MTLARCSLAQHATTVTVKLRDKMQRVPFTEANKPNHVLSSYTTWCGPTHHQDPYNGSKFPVRRGLFGLLSILRSCYVTP